MQSNRKHCKGRIQQQDLHCLLYYMLLYFKPGGILIYTSYITFAMCDRLYELSKYEPPAWAKDLAYIPQHRVRLGMFPTPISTWKNVPNLPKDIKLSVKRDDMTGSTLCGNKVRKLEFILGKALAEGYDAVITCGGSCQSNHGRATAIAARELGLDCHMVVHSRSFNKDDIKHPANLMLDCFVGTKLHHIVQKTATFEYESVVKPKINEIISNLALAGTKTLCIPVGGSDTTGMFG